jgi:hypothetical protein
LPRGNAIKNLGGSDECGRFNQRHDQITRRAHFRGKKSTTARHIDESVDNGFLGNIYCVELELDSVFGIRIMVITPECLIFRFLSATRALKHSPSPCGEMQYAFGQTWRIAEKPQLGWPGGI